jgi:hypothetical protein
LDILRSRGQCRVRAASSSHVRIHSSRSTIVSRVKCPKQDALYSAKATDLVQYQRYIGENSKLSQKITVFVSKTSDTGSEKGLLMFTKHTEWPAGGSTKWLTDWQKIVTDCERSCPALSDLWAIDFRVVWGKRLCDRLGEATREELANDWDIFKASGLLLEAYGENSMRSGMRTHNKGKV